MKSYIKCINVDYESSRTEQFNGEQERTTPKKWNPKSELLRRYRIECQGNKNIIRLFPGLRRREDAGW